MLSSAPVLFDQLVVRKFCLRILVQIFHIGMCGRRIEIEVVLLHILAVIAFVSSQPEQALLENRVSFIPKRHGKADHLPAVANARDPVFVPAIGSRTCMVMRQIFPGISIRAVVLAHGSPRSLTQIGSPTLPMFSSCRRFGKPVVFCGCAWAHAGFLSSPRSRSRHANSSENL